jgi:hypothetical protein
MNSRKGLHLITALILPIALLALAPGTGSAQDKPAPIPDMEKLLTKTDPAYSIQSCRRESLDMQNEGVHDIFLIPHICGDCLDGLSAPACEGLTVGTLCVLFGRIGSCEAVSGCLSRAVCECLTTPPAD